MSYKLYFDDLRTPKEGDWVIVRTLSEFRNYILEHGVPDFISFDHDLGIVNGKIEEAITAVHWLIEQEIVLDDYAVHSANPVGKKNIECLLENWKKFNED